MKINKEFAPIIITLETSDDLLFLKTVLEAAYRDMEDSYRISLSRNETSFQQKVKYMLGQLK